MVCSQSPPAQDLEAEKKTGHDLKFFKICKNLPVGGREKDIEGMDEEDAEQRFEAKKVRNCSTSFSHTGATPPCLPPEKENSRFRKKNFLFSTSQPQVRALEGGLGCLVIAGPE